MTTFPRLNLVPAWLTPAPPTLQVMAEEHDRLDDIADRLDEVADYLSEIAGHLDSIRFMVKAFWVVSLIYAAVIALVWVNAPT